MNRRGHSLILILVVIAMGAAASAVFFSRLSLEQHRWQPDQVRTQALWLARSALDTGVTGQRQVSTSLGEATVDVGRNGPAITVTVTLERAQATVQKSPYVERYEAR